MSLGPLIRSLEWHFITNTVAVFFHVIAIFFGFYTTEFENLHPEEVLPTHLLNCSLGLITYIAIYNSVKEADTIWVERKSNAIHTTLAYICIWIKAFDEKVPFLLSWISAFTVLLPFLLSVVTLVRKQPPRQHKKPESISLGPHYSRSTIGNAQLENVNKVLMPSQAVTGGTPAAIRDYFQSCTREDVKFLGRPR